MAMSNNVVGFDGHLPYAFQANPAGAGLTLDLHPPGFSSSSLTSRTTIRRDALAAHSDSFPTLLGAASTTDHGPGDQIGVQALLSNMIGHDISDSSTGNTRRATKRKAPRMKSLSRKRLTDLYSKRSMTLEDKGRELTEITDAFVVIYSARPESIGEGRQRLFVSQNLGGSDGPLAKRISDDINAVAKGSASVAMRQGALPHKKTRTGHTSQRASGSTVQGAATHPVVSSHTTSTLEDEARRPALTNGRAGLMESSCESEITPIVDLLKNDLKVVQSSALAILSKLVLSDHGVAVIHNADAIPRLVELLNPNPEWDHIAYQSLLVLSHMADHQRPCMAMVKAGVVTPLGRLLSHPMSKDALVLVVQTISRCSQQFLPGKAFRTLFVPGVLQSLIGLLSSNHMQLWVAAVEAIDNIVGVEDCEPLQYPGKAGIVRQLCHLFSRCADLPVLEKLASAIGRTTRYPATVDIDDVHLIQEHVLPPMLGLLGRHSIKDQIGACRALRLCYSFGLKMAISETIFPQLGPLLSSDSDELFVEVLHAVLRYSAIDYIDLSTFRRLICLLFCDNELVLANVARCISQFFLIRSEDLVPGLAYEMGEMRALQRLVGLISSHNLDLATAATNAVAFFYQYDSGMEPIYRRLGVTTAIVRCATSNPHSPAKLRDLFEDMPYLSVYADDEEQALAEAGLVVPLLHLLSSPEGKGNPGLISFIGSHFHTEFGTMLLHAGIARPLTESLSYHFGGFVDGWAVDEILELITLSSESRLAFKAAGIERVLSGYLADDCTAEYRVEVEEVIASFSSYTESD